MMKTTLIAVGFALALCAGLAYADSAPNISQALTTAMALHEDGKSTEAVQGLTAALAKTAEAGWNTLTTADLMKVAAAQKLLMAMAYEQAMKREILSAEDAKMAKHWYEQAMGMGSVREVSFGEEIDLEKLLIPGKTNIVDFFSIYCSPCVRVGVFIDALAEQSDDIVLIKVNINRPGHKGIDWQSPLAKQFGLQSIPYLRLYSPEGKLLSDGEDAYNAVMKMIEQAGIL